MIYFFIKLLRGAEWKEYFLLREEIKCSYPTIGQELGGRDHTTAMHAYEKIKKCLDKDEKIRQDINLIRQRLYNK